MGTFNIVFMVIIWGQSYEFCFENPISKTLLHLVYLLFNEHFIDASSDSPHKATSWLLKFTIDLKKDETLILWATEE